MIKRLLFLLVVPMLMGTQCEDDLDNSGFETKYLIKNESSIDLYLIDGEQIREVAFQNTYVIASDLNSETKPIIPSQTFTLTDILLYAKEGDNYILVYEQSPIDDSAWEYREPQVNRFEYTLFITDGKISSN